MEAGMSQPMASQDPQSMPEIERELTMAQGAFISLDRACRELVAKLEKVTRDPEPEAPEKIREIPDHFPVRTPLGRELEQLRSEMGALENFVIRAHHQLGL